MKIAHITTIDMALHLLLLNQLKSLQQAGLKSLAFLQQGRMWEPWKLLGFGILPCR